MIPLNMKQYFFLVVIVVFSFGSFACKKDNPVDTGSGPEPTEFRHAFYPMAVGNSWVYADTSQTLSGPVYSVHTVRITGWHRDSLGVWWNFESNKQGTSISYELMEKNDSIFTLQYGFTVDHHPFAALEYLYPHSADTTFYTAFIGGDAMITKAAVIDLVTYRTPSGNYKGVVQISSPQTNLTETFAKGIGIVGTDEHYVAVSGGTPVGASSRLKSFTLMP